MHEWTDSRSEWDVENGWEQEATDRIALTVGEAWPFLMEPLGLMARLWEHPDGSLVLTIVLDIGAMEPELLRSAHRRSTGILLLPSGPNLWCIATAQRTTRIAVEFLISLRRLRDVLRNDVKRSIGLVLVEEAIISHVRDLEGHADLWLVLERWVAALDVKRQPRVKDRQSFAMHDRSLLSTHEMKIRATRERERTLALRSYDLEALGKPAARYKAAGPRAFDMH